MRLLFCLLFAMFSTATLAQPPSGINYQAVARDAEGNLLTETAIILTFSILPDSATANPQYQETHELTTDAFGQFTAIIGQGVPVIGTFTNLDWARHTYFLEVAVNGESMGALPFLSVPYALATPARKGVFSVAGSVFQPNSNDAIFRASVGQGGSEITTPGSVGTNVLTAPVSLPQGARINKFTVFFKDESEVDLSIRFDREYLLRSGVNTLLTLETMGDENGWRSMEAPVEEVVDNTIYGYYIRVFCDNWSALGSKAIKGVSIEYEY